MKTKRHPPVEREVKLHVRDAKAARAALSRIGATLECARQFEDDVVLDDASSSLLASGCLLRIRRLGSRAVITYKGPKSVTRGVKSRREVELETEDAGAARELFARLGYVPVFRYQKYREVYGHRRVKIMLDETPIGTFFEIEGRPTDIHRTATSLGYEADDYISESYADLFVAAGGAGHMVF